MQLTRPFLLPCRMRGVTLIEVLVTIIILAFGLLGLAGLQSKINLSQMEAFERAQAIVLLTNLSERMQANNAKAGEYVTDTALGTQDDQPESCDGVAAGSQRDLCEWSKALKGASEVAGTTQVGAMTAARGCITQVQAPNPAPGACTPGLYRISVAWQGNHMTKAPADTCGKDSYGDDKYRRVISTLVAVGLPTCQ